MRVRFESLDDRGVAVRARGLGGFIIQFEEILTAERLRSRRGLDLHTRTDMKPTRMRCRRRDLEEIESGLRFEGVRVVDCWGAIIAPTLLDFEEELARGPVGMRQSSDNGRSES
jgi:hypothetical protein